MHGQNINLPVSVCLSVCVCLSHFLLTRLPMDRLGRNLGGHIPLRARYVRHDAVAMATAVASNSALNIQQLWASGGRTREPILTKFGTQQKITTTMTVT